MGRVFKLPGMCERLRSPSDSLNHPNTAPPLLNWCQKTEPSFWLKQKSCWWNHNRKELFRQPEWLHWIMATTLPTLAGPTCSYKSKFSFSFTRANNQVLQCLVQGIIEQQGLQKTREHMSQLKPHSGQFALTKYHNVGMQALNCQLLKFFQTYRWKSV